MKRKEMLSKKRKKASSITEGYIVIPQDKKFLFLLTLLRKNANNKVIVYFSNAKQVEFISTLLKQFHIDTLASKDTKTFDKEKKGILLLSSPAKALPVCSWVIHYDAPQDKKEYEERLNPAEDSDYEATKSLLVLFDHEAELATELGAKLFDFSAKQIINEQKKVEKIIYNRDHYLYTCAIDAYRAFLKDYVNRKNKKIFDFSQIDVTLVCKNFGYDAPPFVNIDNLIVSVEEVKEEPKHKRVKSK